MIDDHPRLRREWRTVEAMLLDFCAHRHQAGGPGPFLPRAFVPYRCAPLCPSCEELRVYARKRLDRCVYQEEKPTCSNCPVHCYGREMKARMQEVMRISGPRLTVLHPWLALMHLVDGFRTPPPVREVAAKRLAEKKGAASRPA